MKTTTTLMLMRSAPYADYSAREGLDAALAFAAFDRPMALLFLDDGVFQLCGGQQPATGKCQEKMLSALPIYGIEDIFVHETSLQVRGLTLEDLSLPITPLSDKACGQLIAQARHTLSF